MATYNDSTKYPLSFYDNGGGSYGLVNPNLIQSGTLQGDIQVGTNGPVISPSTGSIFTGGASPIVINSAGITIGGSSINVGTASAPTVDIKKFNISPLSQGIFTGDGYPLFTPNLGDVIYLTFAMALVNWHTFPSAGQGSIYMGVKLGDIAVGSINDIAIWSTNIADLTFPNAYAGVSNPTLITPYLYGGTPGTSRISGPYSKVLTSNPICIRAVPSGANQFDGSGSTDIYVLVYHPN